MKEAPAGGHVARSWCVAVVAGAMVPAIHEHLFPWQWHQFLRDWAMHFVGLVAATIFTVNVLGYHGAASWRHRRTVLRIGLAVPLAITLLHELGQWVWPAGARDAFDAVRDALLNVGGAVVGWLVVRRPGEAPLPQRAADAGSG